MGRLMILVYEKSLLEIKVKGNRDPGAVDEMSEVRFSFGSTDGLGAYNVLCVRAMQHY